MFPEELKIDQSQSMIDLMQIAFIDYLKQGIIDFILNIALVFTRVPIFYAPVFMMCL